MYLVPQSKQLSILSAVDYQGTNDPMGSALKLRISRSSAHLAAYSFAFFPSHLLTEQGREDIVDLITVSPY